MTSVSSLLISLRDPTAVAYMVAYGIVGVGISIVFAIAQAGIIAESSPDKLGRNAGYSSPQSGLALAPVPLSAERYLDSSLAVPFIVPPIGFVIFLAAYPLLVRKKQ